MRYTRIDLDGREGYSAKLTRTTGSDHLKVEVLTPSIDRPYSVELGNRDQEWAVAEAIQEILDGQPGTWSDINEYYDAISRVGQ